MFQAEQANEIFTRIVNANFIASIWNMCVCKCVGKSRNIFFVSLNLHAIFSLSHLLIHITYTQRVLSHSFSQQIKIWQHSSAAHADFADLAQCLLLFELACSKRWVAPEVHFAWLCVYRHFLFTFVFPTPSPLPIHTHAHWLACWYAHCSLTIPLILFLTLLCLWIFQVSHF